MPRYFVGQLIPSLRDVPKAVMVASLLLGWALTTVLLQWQWVGLPRPYDPLIRVGELIFGPVTEEIVGRGVILAILLKHTESGRFTALLISALLFAGVHTVRDIYEVVILFVGGLVLGYGYMTTKSVPFCILSHSTWNGLPYLFTKS